MLAACKRIGDAPSDCGRQAIERAEGEYVEVPGLVGQARRQGPFDYLLGFVEYDDHGAPTLPGQLGRLMEAIDAEAAKGDLAMVVYVHGWKHNAAEGDRDVEEFRWLLRGLSTIEQSPEGRGRKVVGVYAGWPGLSLDAGVGDSLLGWLPKQLTFFSRKNAAHRVAKGSIRDLFAAVREVQTKRNGVGPEANRCGGDTRLVLIGHSFGGLIVYDAVHQHMVESARSSLARGQDEPVPAYGNMVVLLNPAFEGVAYASIHDLVAQRSRYADGQAPVMVTFQSLADVPNRSFFPFGRRVSTVFQRTRDARQTDENRRTVGFVERFWTHRLSLAANAAPVPPGTTATETPAAPASRELSPQRQAVRERQREEAQARLDEQRDPTTGRLPRGWSQPVLGEKVVLHHQDQAPDNPFWVVATDPTILKDHGDIWNDEFLATLNDLYARFVRPPATACPRASRAVERGPGSPARRRGPA